MNNPFTSVYDLFKTPLDTNVLWSQAKMFFPDVATAFTVSVVPLSSSLLLFAAFGVLSWHVLSGIVASAYSGKVLGERWHQIWAPGRVVIGIGLLAPALASGLSGVHLLIKHGVIVGINIADQSSLAYVKNIVKNGMPITPTSAHGTKLVFAILENEVCREIVNARPIYRGSEHDIPLPSEKGEVVTSGWIKKEKAVRWDYGPECGSISISMPEIERGGEPNGDGTTTPVVKSTEFAEARRKAIEDLILNLRNDVGIAKRYAEVYAQGPSYGNANAAMAAYLEKAGVFPTIVARWVRDKGEEFDGKIQKAAAKETSAHDIEQRAKIVKLVEQEGTAALGKLWTSLGQVSALTAALGNEPATRRDINPEAFGPDKKEVEEGLKFFRENMAGQAAKVTVSANDIAWAGDRESDLFTRFVAPLYRPITEWVLNQSPTDNPTARLITLGHTMTGAATVSFFGGGVVAAGAKNIIADSFGAGGVLDWFAGPAKSLMAIVYLVGTMLAYVLPMIPYIVLTFATLAWLVAILEAVIVGPIWAFIWVRMDGQELVDQHQHQGLMILLINLVLRLPVTVLALIGANMIVNLPLGYMMENFGTTFTAQQGGHIVHLGGMLTGIVMLVYLSWHIILRLHLMVIEAPNRIGTWLNTQTTGWSDGDATHAAMAGMGAMAASARGMGGGMPKSPQGGGKPEPDGIKPNAGDSRAKITHDNVRARGK